MRASEPAPGPRDRLLEAALRVLADEGPEALQARKLAAEVGASTMAVYTHFGGMRELVDALAREGFVRLDRSLADVPRDDDPVTHAFTLALAYRAYAVANPHLYRMMFGLTSPAGHRLLGKDLITESEPTEMIEGQAAFAHIVEAAREMIRAGRIRQDEPLRVAAQLWSLVHGYVLLELTGCFGEIGDGVDYVLRPLGLNLVTGLGDTAEAAAASARRATGD